uniref:Uncharacterized protein n=1 Tax=Marseillevirus LCMAC101 TaxID=2506602 RepID=A0A481YS69_9VIRU|nr:MAG: hypothetical protein LCMAC101_06980 [Marseillevirus LCMAC101]
MSNLDKQIGFWLEDVPYVWISGKTKEECYRYYLFSLYNEENLRLYTIENVPISAKQARDMVIASIPPLPSFSIFPFTSAITRNCSLVWVYSSIRNQDIRIQGDNVKTYEERSISDNLVIINPKTDYRIDLDINSLKSQNPLPPAPLDLYRAKSVLDFSGLREVKNNYRSFSPKPVNLEDIHIEALLNRMRILFLHRDTAEAIKYTNVLERYVDLSKSLKYYKTLVLCHGRSHRKYENLDDRRTVYVDPEETSGADLQDTFPSLAFTKKYGNQLFDDALLIKCPSFIFDSNPSGKRRELKSNFWNKLNVVLRMNSKVYIYWPHMDLSESSDTLWGVTVRLIVANSEEYGFKYDGFIETPYSRGGKYIAAYTLTKIGNSKSKESWVYQNGVDPIIADKIFKENLRR